MLIRSLLICVEFFKINVLLFQGILALTKMYVIMVPLSTGIWSEIFNQYIVACFSDYSEINGPHSYIALLRDDGNKQALYLLPNRVLCPRNSLSYFIPVTPRPPPYFRSCWSDHFLISTQCFMIQFSMSQALPVHPDRHYRLRGFQPVLDYILVIRIGYTGAAVATALTYFLFAVIKEVYFRTRCKNALPD